MDEKSVFNVTTEGIRHYLTFWDYKSIWLEDVVGNQVGYLKKLVPHEMLAQEPGDDTLQVVEDCKSDFSANSITFRQLIYDLEVFSELPEEIRDEVTLDGFIEFMSYAYKILHKSKWKVMYVGRHKYHSLDSVNAEMFEFWDSSGNLGVDFGYEKILLIVCNGNSYYFPKELEKRKWVEVRYFLTCIRVYVMSILCRYLREEYSKKGIRLQVVNYSWAINNPVWPMKNPVTTHIHLREKYLLHNMQDLIKRKSGMDFFECVYGKKVSWEYLAEISQIPQRFELELGKLKHLDCQGKYLNICEGERNVFRQPDSWEHTVCFLGGCVFFGYMEDDAHTVPSYLQQKLNEKYPNRWRVVNLATWGGNIDQEYRKLEDVVLRSGDLLLVSYAGLVPLDMQDDEQQQWDVSVALKGLDGKKYFNSLVHCGRDGYFAVADKIFTLYQEHFLQMSERLMVVDKETLPIRPLYRRNIVLRGQYRQDLEKYIEHVKGILSPPQCLNNKAGAIVMNANPFTKGHKHLIEHAAGKVPYLFVFVVENDASDYSFKDRLAMVRAGINNLHNVGVVGSGTFMISAVTFPGYFLKEKRQFALSNLDVKIFGQFIAPALQIGVRFVGSEPFDNVTASYNSILSKELEDVGIRVIEVPRLKMGQISVSASQVRLYVRTGDWQKVRSLVPYSTYIYMRELHKNKK